MISRSQRGTILLMCTRKLLAVLTATLIVSAPISRVSAAPVPEGGDEAQRSLAEPQRRIPPPPPPEKRFNRKPREQQDSWEIPRKDIPEKTRLGSFESTIVHRTVSYLVYLPPGYERMANEKMRYPVIYMLPPLGGDARQNGPMILKVDEAITDAVMPPVICVSVQGIWGSMYVDARDGGRPIETVIMRELIPRIDSTFRTIPDREHRAVEGYSMGGYGAARLGFKYPDVFGVVSLFAPLIAPYEGIQDEMPMVLSDVWRDDRRYFAETDPWNLVAHNADQIRGKTKIRLYCGDQDVQAVYSEDFHLRLNQLGIEHEYRMVLNGPHSLPKMLMGVRERVLPFWKEVFPPYVPPATTQSSP